jgi:hypothetical protein
LPYYWALNSILRYYILCLKIWGTTPSLLDHRSRPKQTHFPKVNGASATNPPTDCRLADRVPLISDLLSLSLSLTHSQILGLSRCRPIEAPLLHSLSTLVLNFSNWLSFILISICWDGLGFGSRVWILANELVGLWYLIFRFFLMVIVFLCNLPQNSLIVCKEIWAAFLLFYQSGGTDQVLHLGFDFGK